MKMGKSIRGALSYNEDKVAKGNAELILASNFSRDISDMGFSEKLARFEKLNELKENSQTNTLHLSLNFAPGEVLYTDTLQRIAADYMERIGFADQPFLVYRHHDANHPHIHIVTNTIRPDGKAIFLHNLAKRKSEPARKAIEKEFDLIPAESMRKEVSLPLNPIDIEKAIYGEGETKQKISNIVREVTSSYHFASINELNAILKQYNVIADPGRLGTKMNENKGLVYSLIDKSGNKVGVPIKASSIYTSPTLKNLEKKFEKERTLKNFYSSYTTKVLEDLLKNPKQQTEKQLKGWLARRKINYELVKNQQGVVVDVQFVDNAKKVVLHCADLNIQLNEIMSVLDPIRPSTSSFGENIESLEKTQPSTPSLPVSDISLRLLNELLAPDYDSTNQTPESMKKKKKKRKRKY